MNPKVSIVIPTFNRAHYLPEALECALNQTYPNIEIIVVNDGSTDNTESVLAPYMKRIRYIKRKNGGCAAAKNTALKVATGEFITNLDDDDRIVPEKIARQVEMFKERPSMGVCGTGVAFIDAEGKVTGHYRPPALSRRTQVLELLRKCILVQSSVLIHQKCHQRLGNYKITHGQDYDFWLRVALHYEIGVIPDLLTSYRHHGEQITGQANRRNVRAAVARIILGFLHRTPVTRIIPDVRSYPECHALLGLSLCEQRLFGYANTYLQQALPNPAAHIVFFVLKLHERQFAEASDHIGQVEASESPFTSNVEEGRRLMARVVEVTRNASAYNNTCEKVVQLRADMSRFHTSVARQLLRLAS